MNRYKRRFFVCIILLLMLIILVCMVEEYNSEELTGGFSEGIVTIYENGEKTDTYVANLGTIVIDPGHGGVDPGKVSGTGAEEKHINLSIALKLKPLLEAEGYTVVLTRETDEDVCTGSYSKIEDLENRVDIIGDSEAMFMISIHQNSYPDDEVKGAQVFYAKESDEGKNIATAIQNSLLNVDNTNTRQPKANSSYYLFVNTDCPVVIVECGFLSNPNEEKMLLDEEYQQSVAEAIRDGICEYQKSFQN